MGNDSKLDSVTALPSDRAGGLRPEPAAQSQPEALIPSAWLDHKAFKPDSYQGKPRHMSDDLKAELQEMVDKILAHIEWLPEARKVALLDACLSVSPVNCSWQQHAIAGVAVWQVQACLLTTQEKPS